MVAKLYFEHKEPRFVKVGSGEWNQLLVSVYPDYLKSKMDEFHNFVIAKSEGNNNQLRKVLRKIFSQLLESLPVPEHKQNLCFMLVPSSEADQEFKACILGQLKAVKMGWGQRPQGKMRIEFPKKNCTIIVGWFI